MSEKIVQTFDMKSLHNSEELSFHLEVFELVNAVGADHIHAEDIMPGYIKAVDTLDKAIKTATPSEFTPDVTAARDGIISTIAGLTLTVSGLEHHINKNTALAAAKIHGILDLYKGAARANYEETAADGHNIVADLSSERFADSVDDLGLSQWVSTLDQFVKAFYDKAKERHIELGSRVKGATKAARDITQAFWLTLRQRVSSFIFPDAPPNTERDTFANGAKDLVRKYDIVAKTPKPHKKPGHNGPHAPDSPDNPPNVIGPGTGGSGTQEANT